MIKVKISIITSLYRGEKYLRQFLQHLSQISNPKDCEIIIIHNDPTVAELDILSQFENPGLEILHLKVLREPLYSSWNRAISAARGEYLTIWNIDDVRLPSSIQEQANALDTHVDVAIAYGDFVIVNEYGCTDGSNVVAPKYDIKDKSFLRQHHIGPFPMWRKSIHDAVGYFDEQLRLIADLDFQIRVAKCHPLIKVDKQLGYYLEGTSSNLSNNHQLQDLEYTVLYTRYANYDLIFLTYVITACTKFKVFKYKWFGDFHPVNQWFENTKYSHYRNLPLLFISILNFPKHLAKKYLRQVVRKYSKYNMLSLFPKMAVGALPKK
jgi:glycosyltransferase involved in cell wall biosynthesis